MRWLPAISNTLTWRWDGLQLHDVLKYLQQVWEYSDQCYGAVALLSAALAPVCWCFCFKFIKVSTLRVRVIMLVCVVQVLRPCVGRRYVRRLLPLCLRVHGIVHIIIWCCFVWMLLGTCLIFFINGTIVMTVCEQQAPIFLAFAHSCIARFRAQLTEDWGFWKCRSCSSSKRSCGI